MPNARDIAAPRPLLGLLLRVKLRSLRNRLAKNIDEAPVRVAATVLLIGVVWVGFYFLFHLIFAALRRTPLEATVAIPMVFNVFFITMLVLLTLSNAILVYGALFAREESAFLLAAPVTARDIVTLCYAESLTLSSWSLIVLGLPLMIAMADQVQQPVFYVLFIAFFLAFIPIPGAIGLLSAWVAARFFPRRLIRFAAAAGAVAAFALVIWSMRSFQFGDSPTQAWLRSFLDRMSFLEFAFLPNQWVASGIDEALQGRFPESALYLCVTLANALFLSWIAVNVTARNFTEAHNRAASRQGPKIAAVTQISSGPAGWLFFYLPRPLRLIAAKDLRTFFRDPLQWSQLLILFGLLAMYLTNMPNLTVAIKGTTWQMVGPFLNLCAITLILATFTCRFVFPLMSLEGRNLWMIALLPIPRSRILVAKFCFAMTITLLVGFGAMALSVSMLDITRTWAVIHLAITVALCFGLCGFAVGIGARLPMFGERNVAKIVNGLGGTVNLLVSLSLVAVVLSTVGLATWQSIHTTSPQVPGTNAMLYCVGGGVFAVGAGIAAMRLGGRYFARVEM